MLKFIQNGNRSGVLMKCHCIILINMKASYFECAIILACRL